MIGMHNIKNATAAAALAFTIGLPEKYIKKDFIILKVCKEDLLIYLIIII